MKLGVPISAWHGTYNNVVSTMCKSCVVVGNHMHSTGQSITNIPVNLWEVPGQNLEPDMGGVDECPAARQRGYPLAQGQPYVHYHVYASLRYSSLISTSPAWA